MALLRRRNLTCLALGMLLITAPPATAFTGWSSQTSSDTNNLTSVGCTDTSHCWATDSAGKVLATTNGGSTWSSQTTGVTAQLNGITCTDASHCWAVGNFPSGGSATVIVTSNGGTSWSAQTSGDSGHNWLAIACPDSSHCFASQSAGKIYATTNGGTSWTGQTTGVSSAMQAISCVSTTVCWAAAANGKAYATTNGSSWSAQTTGASNLKDIDCTDTSHCWAAASTGSVYNTANGGTSWSAQSTGLSALNSIDCRSGAAVSCWAVGNSGNIATTVNGGTSWSTTTAGTSQLNGVSAVDASHIWTVGNGGIIFEYVTCSLGSLGVTPPGSTTLPGLTLTGADSSTTTTAVLTADDETGNLAGWNLSATSTTFTNGAGKTLPTTATTITGASSAAASGNCSLPTNSVSYPVTLPAGSTPPTAVKVFNAAANTGSGPANVTLNIKLAVPASAYNGTYSSTWTYTIASGP
jgi:photosystem II stability/assembly factor-like uncharacterized protein